MACREGCCSLATTLLVCARNVVRTLDSTRVDLPACRCNSLRSRVMHRTLTSTIRYKASRDQENGAVKVAATELNRSLNPTLCLLDACVMK